MQKMFFAKGLMCDLCGSWRAPDQSSCRKAQGECQNVSHKCGLGLSLPKWMEFKNFFHIYLYLTQNGCDIRLFLFYF